MATADPERSGSAFGVPVPKRTILVRPTSSGELGRQAATVAIARMKAAQIALPAVLTRATPLQ
jgi:hypothetical protein